MKEASKWVVWLIIVMVVVTLIGWALRPVEMAVERKVFINSHQYQEGKAERAAILEASLAEINSRLTRCTDAGLRSELETQKSVLNVQLAATRR